MEFYMVLGAEPGKLYYVLKIHELLNEKDN